MTQDHAEVIGLQALGWLAKSQDLLSVFIGATGMDAATLRANAGSADTLIAVLDFICMDDRWVRSFCDETGLAYDVPLRARQALPGGADLHWT